MTWRSGVGLALALLAFAAPAAAVADDAQAPPTLTPAVAFGLAETCPGTARYAAALVRGITLAEARAATPVLEKCANRTMLFELQWKNGPAELALAAVELSRGLLEGDPALLARAASETRRWRDASAATDPQIRSWTVIPDYYDVRSRTAVVDAHCGGAVANGAYIYLAARSGSAWIRTPREISRDAVPSAACMRFAYAHPPAVEAAGEGYVETRPTPLPDEVLRPTNPAIPPR